ncbi:MAG: multiprotein bridging factor aMBF1 [Candidatus Micrarchaeia archaeon]
METCEICGRETDMLYVVEVEGAVMDVCSECAKGKKVIEKLSQHADEKNKQYISKSTTSKSAEEVITHYGAAIRKARESVGLPLKVLAERINEKESTLLRVEEEKTLPNITLTKKLEKELGIKLTEQVKEEKRVQLRPNEPITLWDAAEKKEKAKHGSVSGDENTSE